jgi:drug/metabolite transporter (DMT)-like permease
MNPVQEASLDVMGGAPQGWGVGPFLVLFSAACFGAMAVFGKLAFAAGVPVGSLVLLRFTAAALLLGALLLLRPSLRRDGSPADRPRWPAVLVALGLGAFGYAVQASLYFAALERLDAPLVALVLYTFPVMVTVGAVLLGRERFTATRVVALVVASLGTVLVLAGAGGLGFDTVGVLLALAAAVTYTVYILVSDTVLHRLPPVVLTTLVMTGAAGALALRTLVTGGLELSFGGDGWFWIGCIVVVSTVVAVLAFFAGLRRTGASTTSILSTFEPVVSAALAAAVLGQVLAPVQLLGGVLVLAAAVIVSLRPRARSDVEPVPTQDGVPAAAQAGSRPSP